MSITIYSIIAIAVAAVCTFATRLVPFALFGGKKEVPQIVNYLGKVLPAAIIATLIIYCVRSVDFTTGYHGAAEILAILLTAVLHLWKGNTLISIGGGTIFYMFLIQCVFV